MGEHLGAWQKRTLFEEAARAPLFIRAPLAAGNGRASRAVVEFVDIYPTVAALAGVPAPANLAGRSLVPLLENPTRAWSGRAFTQVLRPNDGHPLMGRSVRTERWRYTEWDNGRAGVELYDHDHDPHEFNNLARDPAQQATRQDLRRLFPGRIAAEPPVSPFQADRL